MIEAILRLTRSRKWIAIIVGAIALLHGWWILRYGMRWGADITRFSEWGDHLIAHHFNVLEYLRATPFVAPSVLYVAWVTVVAAAKVIAGSNWGMVVVALNWGAVITIAWLVLDTVRRLTSSAVAVTVAGVLLANFEMLTFVSFPGSDILFLALVTVVLVLSLRVAERPAAWTVIGGTGVVLLACLFRPAAPPLVVIWIVALLWPRLGPSARRWVVPVIALLIVVAALLQAAVMQDATRWPFSALREWFRYLKADYDQGAIILGRPETWVAPPSTYGDYLAMIFRRWAYFFAILMDDYSRLHKIANFIYFIPAYGLALAGVVLRPANARRTAATLLFLAVLVTSAFHGLQEVDYDHRYRLPIFPPLIVLAGLGAAEIVRRTSRDRSTLTSATSVQPASRNAASTSTTAP